MIITLIGMSGSGKSYWARQLENTLGFTRYCCDDVIEDLLKPELSGQQGVYGVAAWMGMPYDKNFKERQERYLQLETDVMKEVIGLLEANHFKGNTVIDTSGSVIYTGEGICEKLKSLSTMVYLGSTEKTVEKLLKQYIKKPKPVIWADMYQPKEGESNEEALGRCYKNLILSRLTEYERYAEITIPVENIKRKGLSSRDFLELIDKPCDSTVQIKKPKILL